MTATSTTFDDILDALGPRVVTVRGNHAMARCPLDGHANGDRSPGLSITDNDDQTLVYCHGIHGRCYLDLLDHLDIKNPGKGGKTEKTAAGLELLELYTYEGDPEYQVARLWDHDNNTKTFRQRQSDGEGGWIPNLDGVVRVPYLLTQMQQAIADGEWVLFVEGEKDANNAMLEGLVATTTAQGSQSWSIGDYPKWFKGAKVAIIPDHDPQGERYAFDVARDLVSVAEDVRIVRLPDMQDKGDLSDYLLFHDGEEVMALVEEAKSYDPTQDLIDSTMTVSGVVEKGSEVRATEDGIAIVWPADQVRFEFNHFFFSGRETEAEISVMSGIEGKVVSGQRIGLRSASAREQLRRTLDKVGSKPERGWAPYVERAMTVASEYARQPANVVLLHEVPVGDPLAEDFVIDPYWPGSPHEGFVVQVFADGGSGKSIVTLSWGLSIATGMATMGDIAPSLVGPVLYVDWEANQLVQRRRLQRLANGARIPDERLENLHYQQETRPLVEIVTNMRRYIRKNGIVAVILDSVRRGSRGSANDDQFTTEFYNAAQELGVPVMTVNHIRKDGDKEKALGSVMHHNNVRMAWSLESERLEWQDRHHGTRAGLLVCRKDNETGMEGERHGLHMQFEGEEIHITPRSPAWAEMKINNPKAELSLANLILELLEGEKRWITYHAALASIHGAEPERTQRETFRKTVKRMVDSGKIKQREDTGEKQIACLEAPDSDPLDWRS